MQNIKSKNDERIRTINSKAQEEFEDYMISKEQNRDTNFESRANQMRMMRNKVKGNKNVANLAGGSGGPTFMEV